MQSQSNEPKNMLDNKEKCQNWKNVYVLPIKTMVIMASYYYFTHVNVKEFKLKIHLIKF
jgi:hypothetical protein